MKSNPAISVNLIPVKSKLSCVKASFYSANNNPVYPFNREDDRGVFFGFGFNYNDNRSLLMEIIHSTPGAIRGNHLHRGCTETMSVLAGEIDVYLRCSCPKQHVYTKRLTTGMSAVVDPGTAHAVYSPGKSEIAIAFNEGDPRNDRQPVVLIS